jgi:hypothetical protein
VSFCAGAPCLGAIRNEQVQGLGVVFHGTDAMRAWAHRSCCLGETLRLRLTESGEGLHHIPVRLVHVTRPVDGHVPCFAGLSLAREHLDPENVEQLLRLWTRLEHC